MNVLLWVLNRFSRPNEVVERMVASLLGDDTLEASSFAMLLIL